MDKALQAAWLIFGWFRDARKDRVITLEEILWLVEQLVQLFGARVRIQVPDTIEELDGMVAATTLRRVPRQAATPPHRTEE